MPPNLFPAAACATPGLPHNMRAGARRRGASTAACGTHIFFLPPFLPLDRRLFLPARKGNREYRQLRARRCTTHQLAGRPAQVRGTAAAACSAQSAAPPNQSCAAAAAHPQPSWFLHQAAAGHVVRASSRQQGRGVEHGGGRVGPMAAMGLRGSRACAGAPSPCACPPRSCGGDGGPGAAPGAPPPSHRMPARTCCLLSACSLSRSSETASGSC